MSHLQAYTEHKARKRGRPAKQNVDRHPCGKIVQPTPEPNAEERRRNMATATAARMRHHGLRNPQDAQSPEVGYALGRLHIRGLLDKNEEESALMLKAGNAMGLDYDAYYRLTGIPSPNPKAMDMRRVRGLGGEAPVDDVTKASNRMMAIERVLGSVDRDGRPVMTLCKRLILRDEDASQWTSYMLGHLKRGLKALVEHYGLRGG